MTKIILVLCYIIVAPFIGAILEGFDRKISARMQRRVGPPIRQPLFDVIKLFKKQIIVVDRSQSFLIMSYLLLTIMTGCMFYAGVDLLMIFFVLSSAAVFIYFAATVTGSPMSTMGGLRELVQDMAYEPAVLLAAVGFYLTTGSFEIDEIINQDTSAIIKMPGFFVAFVFILTIKMRKSPFDSAQSHHPHQELVKGLTTEMGAKNLAYFQITEWYETILMLSVEALFIINKNPISYLVAVVVILATYFLEILIDNSSARMKWQDMLKLSWFVTLLAGGVNLMVLMLIG
ncbi:ech hydrogenase subunit B [Butyrivibrio fibrisolvens]|jgi:ech hydrogenase subunit B|uniref:Ech hydrogenase subunit B n=1 Tax=Butyrivibrio fibrisolvens TaxID=831 RepID=A0A1H9UQW1_BUTFI|nr:MULTISPECIES: complex I subunit 1 family protein [Butyrivibrio]MCR4634786.1 NADH-quinone oxidoreductase subunit H [Butyrivibrio sp.]PWT25934.1 Ech hydrogenase subunit EchB [Butyrivibrio fibrisolvens]SES11776.1 ech hydrogenase subunit B [Butyrivibrio fibrisolvens]